MSLFNWLRKTSQNSHSDVNEDVSTLATSGAINLTELPSDILIHIAQFMNIKQLNSFSQCNSSMVKLFYNLDKKKLKSKSNYQKDENVEFTQVQQTIWKPLVLSYYPKFEKSTNVKNWMHVLRRRLQHIKLHGKNKSTFSLEIPDFVTSKHDKLIIENCEWIYKCPLNFKELFNKGTNVAFCKVCNKNVYKVENIEGFKSGISEGKCMAFTYKNIILKGEMA